MSPLFAKGARVLRTVRHLRARQIVHQALHLALHALRPTPLPRAPAADWSPSCASRSCAALTALGPVSGAADAEATAHAWMANRLTVLGLDVPWTGDWNMPGPSPLWRYHLHYHEHLADLAWLAVRGQDPLVVARLVHDLEGWFAACGSGGTPAWDAYPMSVRMASWLRILGWAGPMLPLALRTTLERGVATQVAHLVRSLEWHLDGNHLLRNAAALVLGASCLDGPWADRTHAAAVRLFRRLMADQVHADGWHVERSPMYHVRALRDAIEVEAVELARGVPLDGTTRAAIGRMSDALAWMLRADGSLWLFNDSAQDHGVDLATLLAGGAQAQAPAPRGVRHFRDAAVVVLADECGDRLRIDVGAPAPAHQPAHAHAGALAFELDVSGHALVVDSGCSGYDGDPWRPYLRGTSAHSTVAIDGTDQSEMWATFRVGGRAKVGGATCEGDVRNFTVRAECRSYGTRESVHRRTVRREGRRVTVADEVSGPRPGRIEGFVHFDPSWKARMIDDRSIAMERGGTTVTLRTEGPVRASLHRGESAPPLGWQASRFNHVLPAWTLRLIVEDGQAPKWSITIIPD